MHIERAVNINPFIFTAGLTSADYALSGPKIFLPTIAPFFINSFNIPLPIEMTVLK